MKSAAVRRMQKDKSDAEALAAQLAGVSITFHRRAGEHDQLFGSVTSSELAAELEHKGFNIDRRKIQLDEPIRTLGEFQVPVRLFKEVVGHVKVEVQKEAEAEQ
jgi:large subunit ribosomal protein L9